MPDAPAGPPADDRPDPPAEPAAPVRVVVPVPPELAEAAAEAVAFVEACEREGEEVPGDDCIQTGEGLLCGGPGDAAATFFEFDVRPGDGTVWDLPLGRSELEDLAKGFPPAFTLWDCPRPGCGRRFARRRAAERHAAACRR